MQLNFLSQDETVLPAFQALDGVLTDSVNKHLHEQTRAHRR